MNNYKLDSKSTGVYKRLFLVILLFLLISSQSFANPTLVKDIRFGSNSSDPDQFIIFKNQTVFTARDGTGTGLWISNGTAAGTKLLKRIIGWTTDQGTRLEDIQLTVAGSYIYFIEYYNKTTELWRSNGTSSGTILLKSAEISQFAAPNVTSPVFRLITGGTSILYFDVENYSGVSVGGKTVSGLWRSSGTSPSTYKISDNSGLGITIGNIYYFRGPGSEPWRSNGTTVGTYKIKDLVPGAGGSGPGGFVNFNGILIFSAFDGFNRWLYRSNGTASGTYKLRNLTTRPPGNFPPSHNSPSDYTVVGNSLFFCLGQSGSDYRTSIWVTNGTPAGTRKLKDLHSCGQLTAYKGAAYFFAHTNDDTRPKYDLLRSNGTPQGTLRVDKLNITTHHLLDAPAYFGVLKDKLYFVFGNEKVGNAFKYLWESSGTNRTTFPIFKYAGQARKNIAVVGNRLVFADSRSIHGSELWAYTPRSNIENNAIHLIPMLQLLLFDGTP